MRLVFNSGIQNSLVFCSLKNILMETDSSSTSAVNVATTKLIKVALYSNLGCFLSPRNKISTCRSEFEEIQETYKVLSYQIFREIRIGNVNYSCNSRDSFK